MIVSGTPVTSTAAGVKWNKAGFFFSGDYTGAWQIVVGGKTYDVNGATNNIRSIEDLTNEFARQIRGIKGISLLSCRVRRLPSRVLGRVRCTSRWNRLFDHAAQSE